MSDTLLPQFVLEGRELVELAGEALLALEGGDVDRSIDGALRAFHTLKGSAALFDLAELGALMHASEDLLEEARALGAAPTAELVGVLLEAVSEVERWLDALDAEGEPSAADRASAARLAMMVGQGGKGAAEPAPRAAPSAWALALADRLGPGAPAIAIRYRPESQAYFHGDDPLALMQKLPGLLWLGLGREPDSPPGEDYAPFHCDIELTALSEASLDDIWAVFRLVRDQVELEPVRGRAADASRALRIAPQRVDELAALLDEAIIAKNALAHAVAEAVGGDIPRGLVERQATLDRMLADLHGAVAGLRLAPLGPLFARLSRQARELAAQLGKQAEMTVEGGEVAVDKDVVEGLLEPLVHLLRNALDHGIETGPDRLARGKPARAALRLTARAEGAQAVIELIDDGAGLDVSRIGALAAERGLIGRDEAQALSDEAAHELVFAPGFSTAGVVTEVSGRGVGLDAVRAAVARLGGRVTLTSRPGVGATARLTVPLRAVMTKIAVVAAGGQRYGAPMQSIREVVRLPRAEVSEIRAGRAFVLRDEVLPLLSLAELMGGRAQEPDPLTVMVVGRGAQAVGLAVERVGERIEAPVRPAAGLLSTLPGLQGTLVEGDGRVLMVLDLEALTA